MKVPGIFDVICYAGEDFYQPLAFEDGSGLRDFTGWEARLMVRKSVDSAKHFLKITSAAGQITLTDSTGITIGDRAFNMFWSIPHAVTDDMLTTYGFYDLELTDSLGKISVALKGKFDLLRRVTR